MYYWQWRVENETLIITSLLNFSSWVWWDSPMHVKLCTTLYWNFNTVTYIKLFIIIRSFYSLWSIGHPWRASRHCGLQLSPWPHSMIFLCFVSHPLLFFTMFSSAYLSFYIHEDSNRMQFSLLLLFLYVMCVQSNSVFFFLSDFLLTSDGWFSAVLCL